MSKLFAIGPPLSEKIHACYDKESQTGCWLWTKAKTNGGYGCIWDRDKKRLVRAHRAMFELFVGPIPPGMLICHRCDNPPCVNPEHLFLGSYVDNYHDMMSKGRKVYHKGIKVPRGIDNYKCKLNVSDVRGILEHKGKMSSPKVGEKFGCHGGTVLRIWNGQGFYHECLNHG